MAGPSPAPTVTATGGLKAPLTGLLDKQGFPSQAGFDSVLAGFVVNATWAELQPSPGGPIASGNVIDQAVGQVRAYNAAHPSRPMWLKLRITAGVDAPGWAKSLGGPPIPISSTRPPMTGTVGRFWQPAYQAAYAHLEGALAARYDAVPEIREVVVSGCMTFFAEPFIRQVSAPDTVQNLVAAGYTVEADHACQEAAVRAHLAWRTTRSDLTLNPYQVIEANGSTGTDEDFTEAMMGYCRKVLGPRCVLENNSMRTPIQPGAYGRMYDRMRSLGPPIAFQLADVRKVGSIVGAIQLAAHYGAQAVELPRQYPTLVAPAQLAAIAAALKAA